MITAKKSLGLVGCVLGAVAAVAGCTNKLTNEIRLAPLRSYFMDVSASRFYAIDKNHSEHSTEVILKNTEDSDTLLCDDDNGDGKADNIICNYEPGGKWKWIIPGDSPERAVLARRMYPELYKLADKSIADFIATKPVETPYK